MMFMLDAYALGATVYLDINPHYYYRLNLSTRYKMKSPMSRSNVSFDDLLASSIDFLEQNKISISAECRELIENRSNSYVIKLLPFNLDLRGRNLTLSSYCY